jgi:signal transduction histidine kinase/ActR/RegA family two-component response regulator
MWEKWSRLICWMPIVDAQQIRLLHSTSITSNIISVTSALVMVACFWNLPDVSKPALIGFVLVIFSFRMLRFRLTSSLDESPDAARLLHRASMVTTGGLAYGLIWGAGSFVMYAPGNPAAELALHVGLAIVLMGGTLHLTGYYPAFAATIVSILVPLTARNLWVGDELHYTITATFLLAGTFILLIGYKHSQVIVETFRQRQRNEQLVLALQQENQVTQNAQYQAEEASRDKSRFLASASHDLRQPLNTIALLAQTLRTHRGQEHARQLADKIVECVDSMGTMVDELIDISRLHAGTVVPQCATFALGPLLNEIETTYLPLAFAQGLQYKTEECEEGLFIHTDRRLLLRILSNLASNAVRYTRAGSVRVAAQARADKVEVTVIDSGIGISTKDLPHIFDEYFQVNNPERDRRKGLGLGLATVKRLCDLLDIRLHVQSRLGGGSRFTLTLHRSREPAPKDHREPEHLSTGEFMALRGLPVATPRAGQVILVVDDDASAREAMQMLLQAWGYDVVIEPGSSDALQTVRSGIRPDCILADFRLAEPGNGVDAITRLRAAMGRQVPAVIITGDMAESVAEAANAAGLSVLHKPIKPLQLRAFLTSALLAPQAHTKA